MLAAGLWGGGVGSTLEDFFVISLLWEGVIHCPLGEDMLIVEMV